MNARIPWSPSKQQKKAMQDTIKKKSIEVSRTIGNNMDAAALWALHKNFGFGKKRLRRFFKAFTEERAKLETHYEMDGEGDYLCKIKLKEIGVDVESWNDEFERKRGIKLL